MKNNNLVILVWAIIIGCTMIGGFLGVYIISKETGEYNYDLAIPIIGGTVLGFLIYLIFSKWSKKRNGNVPDFDERSVILMKRYLMIVLYVVLFGSGAVLIILYSMGVQLIETGMLILCLMGLYMLIGFGAFITKRL
ncbi:peptidoglycan/LPS O-acetylase OafA/YrhL [Peribacillus simplex]